MDVLPRLSPKQRVILDLLIHRGEMYGLEMVRASHELKRGTVYVTLARMEDAGYVESREVREPGEPGLPRRLYRATGLGERAYQAWELAAQVFQGVLAL